MGRIASQRQDAAPPDDIVRADRVRALLMAKCLRADGSAPQLRVRNISAMGLCGVRGAAADFAVGEAVSIAIDHADPIPATIAWIDSMVLGLSFREPVDLAEVLAGQAG